MFLRYFGVENNNFIEKLFLKLRKLVVDEKTAICLILQKRKICFAAI